MYVYIDTYKCMTLNILRLRPVKFRMPCSTQYNDKINFCGWYFTNVHPIA